MNPAERITRARIQLITGIDNNKPDEEKRAASFLGTLALGLRVRDASKMAFLSEECKTMGTDGRNLFYNPEFVKSITDDVLLGVVAHEIMHLVYQHVLEWRRASTKQYPELFTMAQEYVVNDAVVNMFKLQLPKKVFLEKDYFGMFTEQVYHELLKKYPPQEQDSLGSTLEEGMVDQHGLGEPSGEPGQGDKESSGNDPGGKALEKELETLSQDLKLKVAQAANAVRMRGNLPAGLERIIDEILEPRLPWRQILAEFLCNSMAKDDYSWKIPNRRHIHRGIVLPALRSESVELAVIFDTSGSISQEELTEAWQETRGIMGAFTSYTIHLMGCDTEVTDIQTVGPWDEPELEKLFVGRGGTDFVAPFVKLKEENINPRAVVYFTADACGNFPDEEPDCPVLWVVKGGAMEVPWGRRVELD